MSGRLPSCPADPARRLWSSSSTAAASSAATRRACRPGWWIGAWPRGSRSRRPTIASRPSAPYPAPMLDGARAIQFLRFQADESGDRSGTDRGLRQLGGAGIALWAGFQDDLADPGNDDPVLRQSSRLSAWALVGAQTSYDPRFIKQLIGGRAHEHVALRPLFGVTSDDEADTPRVHRLYEESSPLNYVSADDPPVILFYSEPDAPLPADARPGQGIHHPRFGAALKAMLDPLGVECILRHNDDYRGQEHPEQVMYGELVDFFKKHLANGTRLLAPRREGIGCKDAERVLASYQTSDRRLLARHRAI